MRIAPLAVTEEAQRLLRATRADFGRLPSLPSMGRITSTSAHLGSYDFEQVRAQSEFLRLVSIIEAYVDSISDHQFDLQSIGRDQFAQSLISVARREVADSWQNREAAFKDHHGFSLGQCSKWSDIKAARDVRNAIAHGLGKLTAKQRNIKTRGTITAAGVLLRGDAIVLSRKSLERCVDSGVRFINDVDSRLLVR